MFNPTTETTLVSQLLDSIDAHLDDICIPMEPDEPTEYEMSVDNADDDELWLSGHRSIFSSYGSPSRPKLMPPVFRQSEYDGFHWDLYVDGDEKYRHLAFERDQPHDTRPMTSLSDWSMRLSSDGTEDTTSSSDPPRTSWHAIKTRPVRRAYSSSASSSSLSAPTSESHHRSDSPLTLYRLFQRARSQQHPCRLYQNFSDKSLCDSLSSSSSDCHSIRDERKVPHPRMNLKSPTTFSQLKLNQSNSKESIPRRSVDQCLQTSIHEIKPHRFAARSNAHASPTVTRWKSTDRLSNNSPPHRRCQPRSSFVSSLPDLGFLTHYAQENPSPPPTSARFFSTPMKSTVTQPTSSRKKILRTVFYCSLPNPSQTTSAHSPPLSSAIQKPRTLKEIKRIKSFKTTPSNGPSLSTPVCSEETETSSSTCSSAENSTSSSGYFSSCNHPRPPPSSYPLKSCLKRTKADDSMTSPLIIANVLAGGVAGDIFTLAARTLSHQEIEHARHRRYSAPTLSSLFSLPFRTANPTCTLSEHDLRAKKSVSFCDDIARRLITPSASPKHRLKLYRDDCDSVPQESLTDSPPNEFNFSDDEGVDRNEYQPMNFVETMPGKASNEQCLIDAFATTSLHILEIKCNDPQSYYLNNVTNDELDRTLRQDLCPLLREVLEDGLRQHAGSLFSKKVNLWRLIDLTTPNVGRFNEAKAKAQLGLPSTVDWMEKFNAFIYQLLDLHELASWFTHFITHRTLFHTYYEPWALVLAHVHNDLFERLTNQLEKLSPLPFRLKYTVSPNPISNSRIWSTADPRSSSLLTKKFNVRAWLRDRKTQVKISPKELSMFSPPPADPSSRPKISTVPSLKRH